mgnify:CR=1 FL=1
MVRSAVISHVFWLGAAVGALALAPLARAGAPDWMRAQTAAPLPEHDEETDAVVLYSETELTVQASGKLKRRDRVVYRILRRAGESYGVVRQYFDPRNPIMSLRAWSIPASGKDYEVREKDVVELPAVENGEFISDLRIKLLRIPAAVPGSVIGYEVEQELRPYAMTDEWDFQGVLPVRESRYSVHLPPGWNYRVFWLDHAEVAPAEVAAGLARWTLADLQPMQIEEGMPPWQGIAGRMVVSIQPPDGRPGGFQSWADLGNWYLGLANGRRDASPEIRAKVQELTQGAPSPLAKIQALARFVQRDIRYVAIELGIGGHQPHAAADVLSSRYGDCKDKATLLASMLKEIGVDSYYVLVNTVRGSITRSTPPNLGFNHAILAIQLPPGIDAKTMPSTKEQKGLGQLLFFDPTHPLIPLGSLPGGLQANTGLLVLPDGGELVDLPQAASAANGVQRTAKFTLDENGMLHGDVRETWSGDRAAEQRIALRTAQQNVDQIKPVESMLTHSLATFAITKASVGNLSAIEKPLLWNYSLEVEHYAKSAADLLLVRPRVFGSLSSALMEAKKPRRHPVEFEAPSRNTDLFEITLPPGYVVEELPPPVDEDLGFIAYRSSTELKGNVLRYARAAEIRELSVPVSKADALKAFFREIENDERLSAVLKRAP